MKPLPSYYRNPIQAANEQLDRLPQGEMKPIDSMVYGAGSFLEDRAGMPNAGRVLQRVGTGSYGEIDPAQAVRGATEVAMQVPQFKVAGTAVKTAGAALKPALMTIARQGYRAALPQLLKATPAVGNAAAEGISLLGSVTNNPNLSEMASIARLATRGLGAATLRRDIDIGEQGAQNLAAARGNDQILRQLAAAKQLYNRGLSNDSVHKQTGWRTLPGEQNAPTHWAYELSDDTAKLTPNAQGSMVSSQLTHPDLWDAYPELAFSTRVPNANLPANVRGRYLSDAGQFEYNPNALLNSNAEKENLLHELQHPIQRMEGWPRGSAPSSSAAIDYADEQVSNIVKLNGLNDIDPSWLEELHKRLAHEHYFNQAGEVQARATGNRMKLTPMQRRARPPENDYDRTREELFYSY